MTGNPALFCDAQLDLKAMRPMSTIPRGRKTWRGRSDLDRGQAQIRYQTRCMGFCSS